MWDLWWTKWRWGRISPSTSVSPANLNSINFSAIAITYHPGLVQLASSDRSAQSRTAQIKKKKTVPSTNHLVKHKFVIDLCWPMKSAKKEEVV
jgi:tRNA A37 threonylcarbamoyltransferase TsaD